MKFKSIFILFSISFASLVSCKKEDRNYDNYKSYQLDKLENLYSQNSGHYLVYIYFNECPYCEKIKTNIFNFLDENITKMYLFDIKRKSDIEGQTNRDKFKTRPQGDSDTDMKVLIDEMKGKASTLEETYFFGTPAIYDIEEGVLKDYVYGSENVVNYLKTF